MSDTEVYCIVGNIIGRQPHNGGNGSGYFKFIKGKANHKNSSNPDDYDYEDGEELPDEEEIELEDEESGELDADRGGGEESEDETP